MPESEPFAPAPSYRALLGVPYLGRVLVTMQISRIASSMVAIVMILFALQRYGSPEIAGLVAFAATAPGIAISPIAGALLDRHGRVRLIILDYVVAAASLALVAALSVANALPAWLLIAVTSVASLTSPLSSSGLRSLFPLMVPKALWERVNAVDSNGWVIATIVGAPLGALAKETLGTEVALIVIAAAYILAALRMVGAPDPRTATESTGRILRDAWLGLRYTWSNPTLRALALSLSTLNVGWGVVQIVVPLLVTRHLGLGEEMVGLVFGISGVTGAVAAFLWGRTQTEGREKAMLVWPTFALGFVLLVLYLPGGLAPIVFVMAASGLLNGGMDIALFTVRQRRTDPAWMGRAFTISMSLNFSGFPIGAAIGGVIAGASIDLAILFGAATGVVAGVLGYLLLPADSPAPRATARDADRSVGREVAMAREGGHEAPDERR